ncbi:MAG: hypothetical protein FWC39_00885 [Bacteroidetes bacterium]|nr:hypothetical protein [Bacteroidota bacterium]
MNSKISHLISLACAFAMFSCNQGEERDKQTQSSVFRNDLLPTSVSIMYEHALEVPKEYPYFKGFGGQMFIETLVAQSIKGTLKVCYPSSTVAFTPEEVKEQLLSVKNEISHMVFDEEWQLDTAKFEMKKYVRSYTLVRKYVHNTDTIESRVATFNAPDSVDMPFENLTLLARNVAYEVSLVNERSPDWVENMPRKRVVQLIIDKALNGQQAYSFVFRETLEPLSLDEVRQRLGEETIYVLDYDDLGETVDSAAVNHPINPININEFVGFAFIEDWYYDRATMRIYKDVKGIAPIRVYQKMLNIGDYETTRSVPFLLYFSNHKEGK